MAIRKQQVILAAAIAAVLIALLVGGKALIGGGGGGSTGSASGGSADPAAGGDLAGGPARPIHVGHGDTDPSVIADGVPAIVEGTVRDAAHAPVAGATVAYWNAKGEQTTDSGGDGRYRIEITTGPWTCAAIDGDQRVSVPQRVDVAAKNADVDFELGAISHVHGIVRDARGQPVAGADVTYEHKEKAVREAFDASLGRAAQTGADGSYRLAVLPGEARLRATAPHQLGHVAVPSVAPGADVAADLVLHDLVALDGRVVDDKGAAVAGASVEAFVTVLDVDLNEKHDLISDSAGRFAVANLAPGWLTLSARTSDGSVTKPIAQIDLSRGDVHDVVLALEAPAQVSGRVVYTDGRPARGAQVRAIRTGYAGRWADTTTDDQGQFTFAGPPDGAFDVTATTEQGSGVAQAATSAAPVEIVVHVAGGIRGTVRVGKAPATSFSIALDKFVPAGNARAIDTPPTQRFAGADGTFEWAHLQPGEYDLLVHAAGAAVAPVHATVTDGAWAELDVALAPGGVAHGRLHAGDAPIANARVEVYCTGQHTFTAADGSFTLTDLPATGCWTTFVADGYETVQRTVEPVAAVDVVTRAAGGQ